MFDTVWSFSHEPSYPVDGCEGSAHAWSQTSNCIHAPAAKEVDRAVKQPSLKFFRKSSLFLLLR
eukprot:m.172480 g.172480  ORF g.172480 m.172480 type:complete len:64 (+) comp53268_c0_seq34:71-262(+)